MCGSVDETTASEARRHLAPRFPGGPCVRACAVGVRGDFTGRKYRECKDPLWDRTLRFAVFVCRKWASKSNFNN